MYPAFAALKGKRVILASSSPRRIEIFNKMGLKYEVVASNFEEDYDKNEFGTPSEYCLATSLRKAEVVLEGCRHDSVQMPLLVVGADTIVVVDGNIYEKPKDHGDAERMLMSLSGNRNISVITSVSMLYKCNNEEEEEEREYKSHLFTEETVLEMEQYDLEMVKVCLDSGSGIDFAGALEYQGSSLLLVKSIHGCYYNLVGFPAARFHSELSKISHLL